MFYVCGNRFIPQALTLCEARLWLGYFDYRKKQDKKLNDYNTSQVHPSF